MRMKTLPSSREMEHRGPPGPKQPRGGSRPRQGSGADKNRTGDPTTKKELAGRANLSSSGLLYCRLGVWVRVSPLRPPPTHPPPFLESGRVLNLVSPLNLVLPLNLCRPSVHASTSRRRTTRSTSKTYRKRSASAASPHPATRSERSCSWTHPRLMNRHF